MRGIAVTMRKIKELIAKERSQYLVFIGLSIAVAGMTGIIYFSNDLPFQRFIGGIDPLIAATLPQNTYQSP
jgi:hypothetical protein